MTVQQLAGIEVFVLSPRLKCPLRLLTPDRFTRGPRLCPHLAVLRRGRPRRADLRHGSPPLTLGPLASPQLLADLVGGVAGGSHHWRDKKTS